MRFAYKDLASADTSMEFAVTFGANSISNAVADKELVGTDSDNLANVD